MTQCRPLGDSAGFLAVAVDIKICGITQPVDAEHAVSLGVERLGVVLAWGPRLIDEGLAAEIVSAAGTTPTIGVVRGTSEDDLGELAARVGLRGIQLHGKSDPQVARTLQAVGLEVWRVAAIDDSPNMGAQIAAYADGADLVLIEPLIDGESGGQGIAMDLQVARIARRSFITGRLGLAGGLNPGNVAEAISVVEPDLVDVSSGVESAPGKKSPELVARFVEAVRDSRTLG
jgi:phosphoribosylanthranilate isomerase